MTFYLKAITQIKKECYSNKRQLKTIIGTRQYINNNYNSELNLDLLSNIHFTSKFHLIRLFKKYYGQTPKQYIIDKRIEQAKELLKNGTNTTETCYAVGFECPSSFSTLFKSRVGLAPSKFQKRAIFTKSIRIDF